MEEIVPQIFHWSALHPDIEQQVHSYFVAVQGLGVLIDPMAPPDGSEWFERHSKPHHIYLTNRLHYRDSRRFAESFGVTVWCHMAGLHEFKASDRVRGFAHGDELPGGIRALEVGALCPEETALLIPLGKGALALGDAVMREDEGLEFVPDSLMGEDPAEVKRGLRAAFEALLEESFEHLLLAHGRPFVTGGKDALRRVIRRKAAVQR